jgi:precorrin-6Y C5,15-methyltransferase (decarboxylating)
MTAWLTVIGITEKGLSGLSAETLSYIESAQVLVGGERQLGKVFGNSALRIDWRDGLDATHDKIAEHASERVVVIASGDPLHYGIGARLVKRFGADAIHFVPSPGAFSLAASRMGWSLPDVICLTVHGRPLEAVNLHLVPGAKLLLLSWDGTTPNALAALLSSKGFGDSRISVLEHMDGDEEARADGLAHNWSIDQTANLNTIAVECIAGPDTQFWSRVPGLPESAYEHDGKITKREVRAATLAALAPLPSETLWDVGAGSGAVGIEWMRIDTHNRTISFENDEAKCDVIERNAKNLGVPMLKVLPGDFLGTLKEMDQTPDAIFIGGGVSDPNVLNACWDQLSTNGRIVANGVTIKAHRALMVFHSEHGGDLVRISIARSGNVGSMTALRPLMDVLQLKAIKK